MAQLELSLAPLPYAALRVFRASLRLTATEKLLLDEIYGLDRRAKGGDGCWVGLEALSDRLGTSRRQILRAQKRLRHYGLLVRDDRRSGRRYWFILAPPEVLPSSDRPDADEIIRCRVRLDDWIDGVEESGQPAYPDGVIPIRPGDKMSPPGGQNVTRYKGAVSGKLSGQTPPSNSPRRRTAGRISSEHEEARGGDPRTIGEVLARLRTGS